MKPLKERFRPASLAAIVGQPCIRQLRELAAHPRSCCILLEGDTGVGKSTAAHALANDLGCKDGWMESEYTICGADLTADVVRYYFGPETPFRFCAPGKGFHVLVIEELEYLNKTVAVLLKDALERLLGKWKLIVVATSNDATAIKATSKALLHRFQCFTLESGYYFADAVNGYLAKCWAEIAGSADMPLSWQSFGWDGEQFSARLAFDTLEKCFLAQESEVAYA